MQAMREQTVALAKALGVVGLINVQYAIKDGVVYVLEVNPRASRTIPFVSKAIGVPLASLAARVMLGETLDDDRLHRGDRAAVRVGEGGGVPVQQVPRVPIRCSVRRCGRPAKCMGISDSFGSAFAKAQLAASNGLPLEGAVLITVERLRQADGHADRAAVPRDGLQDRGDGRARRRICARAAFRRSACSRSTRGGRTAST